MASAKSLTPLPETSDADARRAFALARAEEQIAWYEAHSSRQWWTFAVFQTAAVLLGGLTPVLILWSELPKALQALPAALAAVAAGLVGIFRPLHNKVRYSFTAEALKSERVRYATRTGPHYGRELSADEALDNFVARIEDISMTEVGEWRGEFARATGGSVGDLAPRREPAPSDGTATG